MMPYHIPSFRAGARMLCGKMRNGSVTRSEESITLMTFYCLPHYSSRSFAGVLDDVLLYPVCTLQECNKKEPKQVGS